MLERWRLQAGVRQGLLVLALLVLLAQSLGLAHRFVHASNSGLVHAQAMAEGSQAEAAVPPAANPAPWGWVFGEHKTSADCQLYDQLCHDALGFAWSCVLAFAVPTAWLRWRLRERLGLHARFFSARAPPAVLN
jgi:hypothetical protein